MKTRVLDVRSLEALPPALERAAEVLRAGGLVAFPTETVYGLGANALDPSAVARIFEAKGRPANNPLIVHVGHVEDVHRLVKHWPDEAARLAERFWPGPLTLVLTRRPEVPDIVTAGGPTVAVRMPNHPVALALLRTSGVPIAAPSANRSGQLSPTMAEHVAADLDGRIDVILDGGSTTGGIESTVLDLSRRPARLLRPGLVTPAEIESVIGPIERPEVRAEPTTEALPSPGMLTRHYAPRTPLEIINGPARARVAELVAGGLRIALLSRDEDLVDYPDAEGLLLHWNMPDETEGYAAELYRVLHTLDHRGVHDRILVVMPPDTDEWLGVRDRLRRAAASG